MYDSMACFVSCPYTPKYLGEVFSDVWHAQENGQGSSIELEAPALLFMYSDLGALYVGKAAIQCEMPGGSAETWLYLPVLLRSTPYPLGISLLRLAFLGRMANELVFAV